MSTIGGQGGDYVSSRGEVQGNGFTDKIIQKEGFQKMGDGDGVRGSHLCLASCEQQQNQYNGKYIKL